MNRIITLLALLIGVFGYSQVGIGTPKPSESAELEILSVNKGILIPRIALKSIDDTTTIENGNVNSLLIFNTTDEDDVKPGYYYWYENSWVRMINQSDDVLKAPWQIQNTENQATANAENIYQQGKVAVGFSKDDIVSEKQLEVKGDIKALNQLSSGFYNWVESGVNTSSVGIDPEKAAINIFGTFNDHSISSIASQTTNGTGLITEMMNEENVNGDINSFSSGLKSIGGDGSYLSEIFSNVIENGQSEPIIGVTLRTVNLEKEENSAISLTPSKISLENYYAGQKGASVNIAGEKGITFGYDGSINYTFPTYTGNANQVLTVKDTNSNTDLVWKNVEDLMSQPWKIQNTENQAIDNTDNIYQQGKVAVGFTKDDVVSGKQLEIKGNVKALHGKAGGIYELFETGIDIPLNSGTNFFDEHKGNFLGHIDSESIFTGNAPSHSFLSGLLTSSQTHQNGNKLGTSTLSTEIKDKAFAAIHTTASDLSYATGGTVQLIANQGGYIGRNKSEISINSQSQASGSNGIDMSVIGDSDDDTAKIKVDLKKGIGLFTSSEVSNSIAGFGLNGEDGVYYFNKGGVYAFPTEGGTKNQVLSVNDEITITDANHGEIPAQALVWKDVDELMSQPWKIQNTENQATANTENIYQMGSVAIGVNNIPSFTVGTEIIKPKLYVAGDVSTSGKFWTTNSVYADYVFEKYFNGESIIKNDYEFMTLDYIKEFVKTNKHLPGVTPIKDLQKSENGYSFNITGLTVELLEKTEELFLHTIEQQQQIDELKSQVEENNRRLKMLEELFLNSSK